jgi:CMP-N,N'-diacetyllegionaminic acid synthase
VIDGNRVLALVPARRGSKGLPLKNIRPLAGKPLLAWPIQAARASRYVDRVILSTEDPEFAQIGMAAGADVPFLRPAELASDTAPSIDFMLHALQRLAEAGEVYDYLVLLEPTSPLTEGADIDAALETLHARRDQADSILGVTEMMATHPAYAVRIPPQGLIAPYSADSFAHLPRRQDLEPLYYLEGSLYISNVQALQRNRSFCHDRTLPFVTPHWKSFEVDSLVDFICIEAILEKRELILGAEGQAKPLET